MTNHQHRVGYALGLDLLSVIVFVVIGRRSHDEGSAVAGALATAGATTPCCSFSITAALV